MEGEPAHIARLKADVRDALLARPLTPQLKLAAVAIQPNDLSRGNPGGQLNREPARATTAVQNMHARLEMRETEGGFLFQISPTEGFDDDRVVPARILATIGVGP